MDRICRYGISAIGVACLLITGISLIPNIELPSRNQKSKNASAEINEATSEKSTDLTADEVYDLYIGPEEPLIEISDPYVQPPVRIPHKFPPRFSQGNHSGYCTVRFDLNLQGQPINIETLICTSCLLYTSPSPRDLSTSRMPSSA